MGVLTGCKPRKEVLKGDLDDAIFAADFGDLITGRAPKVYGDTKTFFQNTHPAKQLCKVVEAVFSRLANPKEGGVTIRLSTGFGGGKTHTLMALWHLAKKIDDPSIGTELLPAAGRPEKVNVVAVDAGKAGVPEFAIHGRSKVHSLHGEMFFQLGRGPALKSLGKTDDPEASPNESQIEAVFPEGPVLILLDELVIYMAKLSERGQGNLLGFLNTLTSLVSKRPNTLLIVTDPARQVAYEPQSAQLGAALEQTATRLDDVFDRKVSDFDPIGDEGARVIVRRLFERVDSAAAQESSASYHELYKRVTEEHPGVLRASAASADYARRIVESYPFHPRLLETAQDRLGAMQDFHKSRGVLRLFARIIRDVWEAGEDHKLISAGEINWFSPRIQADLLQRLSRDNFKAAVSADIDRHAGELDGGAPFGIHRRVASALLLESLPLQSNSGFDPAEVTLAVLRPDEAGPEPSEALDRMLGICWHTYPMPGSRGWQFRYEPNIIKQIEERMAQIPVEDAKSRVLAEVQGYFSGPAFKVSAWPDSAKQVPESASLQVILCEDEKLAKAACSYADDSNPEEPMPRRFQNAVLAVAATPSTFNDAVAHAQRLIASELIEQEHRTGESGKLVREQLKRVKPELSKQFRLRACRAFDRIVLAGGIVHTLEEQFQVPDEQILQRAHGQDSLRRFLDAKELIYQANDSLDVNRFIRDVLPGATPLSDNLEVYTAKAVHERMLSTSGLCLIPDGAFVRQTILRGVKEGKLALRLADGRAYDNKGCVEGVEGARRRIEGMLQTFPLDDTVLITLADTDTANEWIQVTEPGKPGAVIPPPPPPRLKREEAITWEKVIEYANDRPLLELHLVARTPAGARELALLAQPLGADELAFSVKVEGALKQRGIARFLVTDVGLNHPTKPIDIAQTLYNALERDSIFEADLVLKFGAEGRTGLEGQLQTLAEASSEDVTPRAIFNKPLGKTE